MGKDSSGSDSKRLLHSASSKVEIAGSNIDLGLGETLKKGMKYVPFSTKVVDMWHVDGTQAFWLLAWMVASGVLGWQAFHMYHGDVDTDCFVGSLLPVGYLQMTDAQKAVASYTLKNGTVLTGQAQIDAFDAPSCNPYGDMHYFGLGVIGVVVLAYMYEARHVNDDAGETHQYAIQMPFCTATWEVCPSLFDLHAIIELPGIRNLQYMGHAFSAAAFFALFYYIDQDSKESKALVHEGSRSLTAMARIWLAVFPTVLAEMGAIHTYKLSREEWRHNHMGWAAMSIFTKTLILLTLHFVLDPQTQSLWVHTDTTDNDDQRNWVIGITSAMGAGMAFFWFKYLRVRYIAMQNAEDTGASQTVQQLQNRLWAYVDFPTCLVIVAMVAYNVTARLHNEHGPTHLPSDFHAALLYLVLVLVGIFSIPTNITNAELHAPDKSEAMATTSKALAGVCTIHMKKPALRTVDGSMTDDV